LRGFQSAEKPDYIWMFDKQHSTQKLLPISQVVQSSGFYEPAIEVSLNKDVEIPGNNVIDKIRAGGTVTREDRLRLTYYVATMMRRVLRARDAAAKRIPSVLADTMCGIKAAFQREAGEGRLGKEELASLLAQADHLEEKYRAVPPKEMTDFIRTPWPFPSMIDAIHGMTWRFLRSTGPSYFLTSDNPVSFFEDEGLASRECELIFPLCHDLLMHCSWSERGDLGNKPARQLIVKECNRRTIACARSFVFAHEKVDWLTSAARAVLVLI
jgi:hypothetical protein